LADIVFNEDCLKSILEEHYSTITRQARALRLAPSGSWDLPWGVSIVSSLLPEYGMELFGLMKRLCPEHARILSPELWPPHAGRLGPVHRFWFPYEQGIEIPWEAARAPCGITLSVDKRVSILYYRNYHGKKDEFGNVGKPFDVLFAICTPKGAPPLNSESHRNVVARIEESLGTHNSGIFAWFDGLDLGDLRQQIAASKANVVHIVSHGLPGRILWQDKDSQPVWYSARQLATYLAGLSLDLVCFSVCSSAAPDKDGHSLVSAVVDVGVEAAVGMRSTLDDPAASAFTQGFYSLVSPNVEIDLDWLVAEGRRAVMASVQRENVASPSQWVLPILIVRNAPVSFRLRVLPREPVDSPSQSAVTLRGLSSNAKDASSR